jgi:hypothetical protein
VNEKPVRRVVITNPRTVAKRSVLVGGRTDLDEQTRVGVVFVASLRRAQLRLALVVGSLIVALLGGIPLLFLVRPHLGARRLVGVPLGWLLLAFLAFPVMCVGAWWYVRAAERREEEFAELVDRR